MRDIPPPSEGGKPKPNFMKNAPKKAGGGGGKKPDNLKAGDRAGEKANRAKENVKR